jgi:uroporphyrin-III C-methyltransferase/precorrin-2 dehydrogenase/sirohydrochlorin ferrochelatase/uroporphyrin-III C-methyltransferase
MNSDLSKGKVILAGAGPGDPELITLKTLRYLQQADVVITDRLVSEELIKAHVKPGAEVVYVGKQAKKEDSTPQTTINDLLVKHALRRKLVVRLKGGDVSFYSNILDELKTLHEFKIPFEIVPGITAASGAAAYAGIPLTARGYSTAVRFLTYYQSDLLNDAKWKDLATTDDTLVFYMSANKADALVEKLLDHGIAATKQMAIIEQATTPFQHVQVFNIYEYEDKADRKILMSPSLIIVGNVVSLHESFQWKPNSDTNENYFKPVDEAKHPVQSLNTK